MNIIHNHKPENRQYLYTWYSDGYCEHQTDAWYCAECDMPMEEIGDEIYQRFEDEPDYLDGLIERIEEI